MKKKFLGLFLALLMLLSSVPAAAESDVWMFAVSAGKADAILVGVDGHTVLVDTGYVQTRGKILAAMAFLGVEWLDAVFVTHTDDDHTDGLEWLAQSDVEIGAWYASAMFLDVKEKKHSAVKAAKERGESVTWLRAGDSVPLGDAVLDVLAPSEMALDKDDNNSLVMMLRSAEGDILLAGDMEFPEESVLLASGEDVKCDVLKVANHADDDTTSEAFVRATSPEIAVISTSTEEKPETPDPRVVALLQSAGAEVMVTQECTGGILVRLSGGTATAERYDLTPSDAAVTILEVVPGEDRIVLGCEDDANVDLSGWMLFSEKGKEWFVLPEGTTIGPGQRLTVGTNSSEGKLDLLWDDKKVVHQSKKDVITLYAPNGLPVSQRSNGMSEE